MLDYRIDTFLCVCKFLSYTKAAEELSITQPAVSQHIKYLEQYYGQKLFNYNNKTLELTQPGSKLKNAMLTIKHDTLHLKNDIYEIDKIQKVLKFGATMSIGEFLLPDLLSKFLKKHHEIQIDYKLTNTSRLLSDLDDRSIDFAFVEGNFPKKSYEHITIKNDSFIAVCGIDYEIGKISNFTDLFLHKLLLRENGSGTREILDDYLMQSGYSFEDFSSISKINSPHTILHLLINNYGISFMYETAAIKELNKHTLKKIPIPGYLIKHELNFIWRKNSIYNTYYQSLLSELME